MRIEEVFTRWAHILEAESQHLAALKVSYVWNISGAGGGIWTVRCDSGWHVSQGASNLSDDVCKIKLSYDDFIALVKEKISPQAAFREGRLKIYGKIGAALKLNLLLHFCLVPTLRVVK